MAALVIPSIFTAIDKISAPVRAMSRNVQKFGQRAETSIARADRAFRRLTPSLGKIGKQFLQFASAAALSAAIIGGIMFSFNTIKEFETGLVGVGKTTGIADENLKSLGRSIVAASNKMKTVSSQKLLELAEAAGQLGVTGTENIIKFSTTLAKLEKASDIQGEEGAKSIARLLTITKEGVGVVDRFASALVALGNASAASESEILSVASEVGRATAAYKLNFSEILGISAALKSLDVAPESAGSAIGKVFRGIELATIKGGDKLKAFAKVIGITPKAVKESFGESPRKTFSLFIKGLGRISDEGGSVAKALIDAGLSGERVSKGIIPLATNFALLEDKINLSIKATAENKALNEEFAAAQKTVTSAINSISRAWSNLVIKQATAGSSLEDVQRALFFVSDNLSTIVKWVGLTIGAFLAFKIMLITARTFLLLYNTTLGISTFLMGGNIFALRGSKVALGAYAFAARTAAIASRALGIALFIATGPIGLIILAIIALIALTVVIVKQWNSWGAALTLFLGPLGLVISLIQSFRRNWEAIQQVFKTEGILAGFKKIGATILDAILMPLQQVFKLLSNLPGVGGFASDVVNKIASLRERLGVNVTTDESGSALPVNVQSAAAEAQREGRFESSETSNVNIRIADETNRADVTTEGSLKLVTVTPTFGPGAGPKF